MQLTISISDITDMTVNPATFGRKLVSLPIAMIAAIEDYRFQNRCKSEVEAIRRLIERGLKEDAPPDRAVLDPDRSAKVLQTCSWAE